MVFQFQFMTPKITIEEESFESKNLQKLFKKILLNMGMGAKTNVGYGQFTNDLPSSSINTGSTGKWSDFEKVDKWEEVIPDKAIPYLKNGAQIDGIIARIEGDNVFVQFTLDRETGEIRKKYRAIRDVNKAKLKEIEQVAPEMPVTIKIQRDYQKFGDSLGCQVKLRE